MRFALALSLLLLPSIARADLDPSRADADAKKGMEQYAFCDKPPKPLTPRAVLLCPHARETPGCEGFAAACDALDKKQSEPREGPKWLGELLKAIGPVIHVLLWIIVIAVILALVIPLIRAWLRSRVERVKDEEEPAKARVEVPAAEEAMEVSDAEVLLARAGEHERRGDFARALSTYLAAALRALDMRGSIRLARDRTNGEYVRAVPEPTEKQTLREIVRDVDHVEYGGRPATADAVAHASKRAIALVRRLPLLLILLCSCGSDAVARGRDPGGDELVEHVLRAQGLTVVRAGPIASLPIPPKKEAVILDATRTPLDEESEPHLVRWVKAGGTLIIVGAPNHWPKAFAARYAPSTSRDVSSGEYVGHAARHGGLEWSSGFSVAHTGDDVTWAATRDLGRGRVIGMADVDLITNAGLARPGNAALLIAILAPTLNEEKTIRIARPEDGTSPPSNPFTALMRAGLGLGLGHALFATLLLFIAVGARRTRAIPAGVPERRAFVEHVEATGALWARTRLAAHALRSYGRWIEEQLRGTSHGGAALLDRAREARSDEPARGDELKTMKALGDVLSEKRKL